MKNRLQQFLNAENINQSQLADMLGVGRPSISHILSGRNNPGYDFIIGMMRTFPTLNIEWLMVGKGKMYKTSAGTTVPAATPAPIEEEPGEENLFTLVDEDKTPREDDIPSREAEITANMRFSGGQSAPKNAPNSPAVQRVITKIVVFFSDGTFTELIP